MRIRVPVAPEQLLSLLLQELLEGGQAAVLADVCDVVRLSLVVVGAVAAVVAAEPMFMQHCPVDFKPCQPACVLC